MSTQVNGRKMILLIPAVAVLVFATISLGIKPAYAPGGTVTSFTYGYNSATQTDTSASYGSNYVKVYANRGGTGSDIYATAAVYTPITLPSNAYNVRITSASAQITGLLQDGSSDTSKGSNIVVTAWINGAACPSPNTLPSTNASTQVLLFSQSKNSMTSPNPVTWSNHSVNTGMGGGINVTGGNACVVVKAVGGASSGAPASPNTQSNFKDLTYGIKSLTVNWSYSTTP
ncbi:MAG: hypothetical protein QXJ74_07630 [Nitrososphaera sp.]|uniref:hypothetical protein n=1 Tax=Nitrososphaera sp. TaxID=1971748 RepID=UPI0017A4C80B|nr:hypothetical protein [Nitrososphaera sp.]NWG37903.1 hypothetical protein [Nitrososphaera sp.]